MLFTTIKLGHELVSPPKSELNGFYTTTSLNDPLTHLHLQSATSCSAFVACQYIVKFSGMSHTTCNLTVCKVQNHLHALTCH